MMTSSNPEANPVSAIAQKKISGVAAKLGKKNATPKPTEANGKAKVPRRLSSIGASNMVVINPNEVPRRINPNVRSSAPICAFNTGAKAAKQPQYHPTVAKAKTGARDRRMAFRTDIDPL